MIENVIHKYLGVPYLHRGRTLDGIDCWGLVISIYEDIGIKVYDPEIDYPEKWAFKGHNYILENYWREWTKVEAPKPFDGVLFKNGFGILYHAGIMLDSHRFIHASKHGVVVSRAFDKRWGSQLDGFYRHKRMTE